MSLARITDVTCSASPATFSGVVTVMLTSAVVPVVDVAGRLTTETFGVCRLTGVAAFFAGFFFAGAFFAVSFFATDFFAAAFFAGCFFAVCFFGVFFAMRNTLVRPFSKTAYSTHFSWFTVLA